MRDEKEIQEMAETATKLMEMAAPAAPIDRLEAIKYTLDWVLRKTDEPPIC